MNDIFRIHKLALSFDKQVTNVEGEGLYRSVLETPAGDIVEVGSASGGSTVYLIEAALKVNKKVWSVDPYPESYEDKALYYSPGITSLLKNSFEKNILKKYPEIVVVQIIDFLENCIDKLPRSLSVVFIDSCHEFNLVKKEFDLLYPRVVSGGVILIHDVRWRKVGQLSNSLEGSVTNMINYCSSLTGLQVSYIGKNLLKVLL